MGGGLGGYGGARRRFELRGSVDRRQVYDDYAHHPTEVASSCAAAPSVIRRPGLVASSPTCTPGPWTSGSTWRRAGLADEVVVMDVCGDREDPVPGVTARLVADAVPLPAARVGLRPRAVHPSAAELARRARPGDLVVTMGAGDVATRWARTSSRPSPRPGARR